MIREIDQFRHRGIETYTTETKKAREKSTEKRLALKISLCSLMV